MQKSNRKEIITELYIDNTFESETKMTSVINEEMSNGNNTLKDIIQVLENYGEEGLKQLIKDGYDLNAARLLENVGYRQKGKKHTPLQEAASEGKYGVIELLLKAGRWKLVLERVQLFGLVDSPPLDSRVPVDSRVQ